MTRYAVEFKELCWQRAYIEAETPEDAYRLAKEGDVIPKGEILSIETQYSEICPTESFDVYELADNNEQETLVAKF